MDANDILNSPEMKKLFNEAKWMLLLGVVSDKKIADSSGTGEDVDRPMYDFLKVFYDHGVEADVVVEALEKLQTLSSKKNNMDYNECVDFEYYRKLVDEAVNDISQYGDYEWFTRSFQF